MKVLIGPANSGKSQRVIARVAEAINQNHGNVFLLAPSMPAEVVLWEKLRGKLRAGKENAFRKHLKSFPDLYSHLLAGTARGRDWLDRIERDRLLRQVINKLADVGELEYFAETARMPGLVAAVEGFLDELWRSGADHESFTHMVESRGAKDRDLARIFREYTDALETALSIDREGAGYVALRALEATSHDPRSLNLALVAADGFDFYTPVQARLLACLSARGVETIATLTYEADRATHLWQRPTFARLQSLNAEFEYLAATPTRAIEQAAARLMTDEALDQSTLDDSDHAPRVSPDDLPVQIISAPDRAAEARAVARRIKRLVIEGGLSLDDITVVCRNLAVYANHLERIFDECGIPLTIDTKLSLVENPMYLAFVRLLELSEMDFSRRACMECLRSPYFDLAEFGLDDTAVALLDIISLEENVIGGREQWSEAIHSFCDDPAKKTARAEYDAVKDESDDQRQSRYETLRDNLIRFFDAITPLPTTAKGFASWVIELAKLLRLEDRLNLGATAGRDQSAYKELISIVNALSADRFLSREANEDRDTSRRMRWSDFLSELLRAVAGVTYNREAPEATAVWVQEIHHLRPRTYRAVFVLGLIEGEFPAKVAERAPYTLVERDELRRAGLDLTETTSDAGADLTQFAKAMNRSSERLYLTYARTDLAGGELLPSYLLEETRAIAKVNETRIAQTIANAGHASDEAVASLDELALITAQTLNEKAAVNSVVARHHAAAREILAMQLPSWPATTRGAHLEQRRIAGGGDSFIRDAGLLKQLQRRYGKDHLWSAKQMNDYGSCAFRFFAHHALRLTSAEEPIEGFGPSRLGIAYHDILEQLYKKLLGLQQPVTAASLESVLAVAEQVCDEALERLLGLGKVRPTRLWEFDKSEIKRRIARLLDREAEWNDERAALPIYFERKFGIDGAKPLIIETAEDEVKLCGIVDRIDQREDGWVVIDYKTARAPIAYREALAGRNLQLPIYAMAASRVISESQPIAAAYYLHIHSRKKGTELPHKSDSQLTVDGLIAHAEARIRDYVARIRRGEFPVNPSNAACCLNCDYKVMCRIQSLRAIAEESEP